MSISLEEDQQTHAGALDISNKLLTKAKTLITTDTAALWEWLSTTNAICSTESSLAVTQNSRRRWAKCFHVPTPWPHSGGLSKVDPGPEEQPGLWGGCSQGHRLQKGCVALLLKARTWRPAPTTQPASCGPLTQPELTVFLANLSRNEII